jgi:hypothetical protein
LLSVIVLAAGLPTRFLLRSLAMPDWLVLGGCLLVCGLFLAGFFLWQPQKILGTYGSDALGIIFRSVPGRLVPGAILRWYQTRIAEVAP